MRRWQGRDYIGLGEKQGIHHRIEAQGAFESILIWLRISRRWKPQFECERTQIAIGNPPAKGENCHEVKLEALPWHGLATAEQLEDHSASFRVFRYGDAGRVADDDDITN